MPKPGQSFKALTGSRLKQSRDYFGAWNPCKLRLRVWLHRILRAPTSGPLLKASCMRGLLPTMPSPSVKKRSDLPHLLVIVKKSAAHISLAAESAPAKDNLA